MAQKIIRTGIQDNAVFISRSAALRLTRDLQKQLKENKKLSTAFQKDPRAVLAAAGLNEDIQREALNDSLKAGLSEACVVTCWHTCWFTDCFCTNNTFTL
jgi:hypothetical protein